jgi:hypothetical protein
VAAAGQLNVGHAAGLLQFGEDAPIPLVDNLVISHFPVDFFGNGGE